VTLTEGRAPNNVTTDTGMASIQAGTAASEESTKYVGETRAPKDEWRTVITSRRTRIK